MKLNKIWTGVFTVALLMVTLAACILWQTFGMAVKRPVPNYVPVKNDSAAASKVANTPEKSLSSHVIARDAPLETKKISKDALLELLKNKSSAAHTQLQAKYPLGYALLGIAGGTVVYLPNFQKMSLSGDWQNAKFSFDGSKKTLTVLLPKIRYVSGNGAVGMMDSLALMFQYQANQRLVLPVVFDGKYKICTEVLDVDDGILFFGFQQNE